MIAVTALGVTTADAQLDLNYHMTALLAKISTNAEFRTVDAAALVRTPKEASPVNVRLVRDYNLTVEPASLRIRAW